MSLPDTSVNSFTKRKNFEAILIPLVVIIFLLGVFFISTLLPKQNKDGSQGNKRELSYYTGRQKVSSEGKTIEVSPRVLQISPINLHQEILGNQPIKVITIIKKEEDQFLPHIKGTIFMKESDFSRPPSIDPNEMHIFVSENGYDSAVLIERFVGAIFPKEKNLNLEGGFSAWKEEGLPVEN